MKYKIAYLIILFTYLVKAQNNYYLGVEELFNLGIEHSTQLKASHIKNSISIEKEALTKIEQLPSISFTATNGYVGKASIYDKNFSFAEHPDIPDWKQNYGLELKQTIYQGGKIKNNIKSASISRQISELSLEKDVSDIKLILINNYLELFRLYKQKDVLLKNIEEAKKRLNNIKNLKKEGIVTNNDVLRSQIDVSNYELSLKETQDNIIIISQQLDIVLGIEEKNIIVPDTLFLEKKIFVENEDYYVQQGYEKYPELRISDYNIEKAKVDEKIAKSKYLPNLFLSAGNNLVRPLPNTSPVQDLYINSWGINLGLSYEISSWFDHRHTLNEAKYNINLQENLKEQTRENIRMKVKSAYIKNKEAMDRIEVLTKTIQQAKENYRITNNKYFNQLSILTDLLDASAVQLNAELQLTTAKANFIYTYYLLLQASGNL